ncbi:RICIN domain-containing protein [Saccharothrix hoggarensis]|uniref:RICIN domain-containing protein n=1 Tax=Saccharothrix hoggarensis TaxID=913853 RepID=A0ABW3R5Z1_9PSEU
MLLAALLGVAAFAGAAEAAAQPAKPADDQSAQVQPGQVQSGQVRPGQQERELSGLAIISQAPEANGKCLDVYNAGGGPQIQMWWCNGWNNQDWDIATGPHGYWRLRPYSNLNMCLDAYKGRGVQVVQYRCDSTRTQEFTREAYQGAYRYRSLSSPSLCLDIYDHGRGTTVQMWDCRDVQHQYFYWQGQ